MRITTTNPTRIPACPVTISFCLEGKRPELPAKVKLAPGVRADFKGKFRELRLTEDLRGKSAAGGRVMLVGLGAGKGLTTERLRRAAAIAAKKAEKLGAAKAVALVPAAVTKLAGGPGEVATALAEGAVMGAYRNLSSKSKPAKAKMKQLILAGTGSGFSAGARRGLAMGQANCFARELQNAPANRMTPKDLASAARAIARKSPRISARILDEQAMAKEKMGLLLSVSRGSVEPARLIHLVYKPKGKSQGRIALVGKGLTFDSGGISIKPSGGMEDMRYDMSGSAAVLGVFQGLTALDVKHEVHGIVVACENMPDGKASKPGDVQTAMNGTTVEIINTDAEGRLALADGLTYTRKHIKPETIIDLATLTGAVVMGLGHELTGAYASTEGLRDAIVAAGEAAGELMWPMPLLDCHREMVKGGYADLTNSAPRALGGGSITAAAFLSHFALGGQESLGPDPEWAHLDIAGTSWKTRQRDWVGGPHGTGVGTRMLLRYLGAR